MTDGEYDDCAVLGFKETVGLEINLDFTPHSRFFTHDAFVPLPGPAHLRPHAQRRISPDP